MPVVFILSALLWASIGIAAVVAHAGILLFMLCTAMALVCVEAYVERRQRHRQ